MRPMRSQLHNSDGLEFVPFFLLSDSSNLTIIACNLFLTDLLYSFSKNVWMKNVSIFYFLRTNSVI